MAQAVIIRSCWDYYRDRERFLTFIDALSHITPVLNAPSVIRWNTHKHYLVDLAALGIATTPTMWVSREALPHLDRRLTTVSWQTLVIKPVVSTNAYQTHLVERGSLPRAIATFSPTVAEWMVQPYLSGVEEPGEHALVFIGGRYSHAFRKVAFRRVTARGRRKDGEEIAVRPDRAARETAERTLAAAAASLDLPAASAFLFARVDLVRDQGIWRLMELELVEPRLRLDLSGRAGSALVEQIQQASAATVGRSDRDRVKEWATA
jgi:hypothetical protein